MKGQMKRIDESNSLTLEGIGDSLIKKEDTIIFCLLERAKYCYNADTYDPEAFHTAGFNGSSVEFMVLNTQNLHAQVGRYQSPEEKSFFPDDLPEPKLPPLHCPLSPPPPVNDAEADSQLHSTTPFTCPYSVTLRRNPSRKARPTPQRAAVPFNPPSQRQEADAMSDFQTECVLPSEHPSRGGGGGDSEDLKVFLRIRPLKERFERRVSKEEGELRLKRNNGWPKARKERDVAAKDRVLKRNSVSSIVVNDDRSVTVMPPVSQHDDRRIKSEVYEGFSQVFAPESSQEQVYDKMMRPLVEDFLKGKSGMLVAMGPSGSGKTHTVFGCARQPGMVPLALRQIFQTNGEGHSTSSRSFYVTIFEISSEAGKGEKILDLLSDGADISIYQSTIKGLQEIVISDVTQAESVIALAMLKRSTTMTNANSQSSRSQCIINIHLDSQKVEGHSGDVLNGAVLKIIDLAGAERSKRTGLKGKRLGESSFINNTSMVFGLCLRSLFEHQKNPKKPLQKHFQSSLLTRYLREYLEGKKRMSLILTVKSEEEDYTDTSFVLRQASPYMQIKFTATALLNLPGAKRHLQTLVRSDHVKRMKFGNFTGPKADRKGREIKAEHQIDEEATGTDEVKESLLQSSQASLPQRSSQIMQSFAKAVWNVLKEYKSKLQDAETKIHSLNENLDFEKTRRMELEREIQYLINNCSCSREFSTDNDLVKLDTYLDFSIGRSRKSADITCTTEEIKSIDDIICHTSDCVRTRRETDSSEGQNLDTCLQSVCDTNLATADTAVDFQVNESLQEHSGGCDHYSDEKVTMAPLPSELAELKENENDQAPISAATDACFYLIDASHEIHDQINKRSPKLVKSESIKKDHVSHAPVPNATDGCSYLLEASHDKYDQKTKMSPELVRSESVENDQLSHVTVPTPTMTDEHYNLLGSPQEKHEQETEGFSDGMTNLENTEQPSQFAKLAVNLVSVVINRVDSPQSKTNKPMPCNNENKETLSKKQLKQKDEICGNKLMENDETHKRDTKPSSPRLSNLKPKRRLMPVSTVLLRDMQLLDLEDESDNRSKGNRGRKNADTEETQRTQGSISLLRLLKSNLHR